MFNSDTHPAHDARTALGPIEQVILQGTALCNLNCSYCYLSEADRQTQGTMSLASIEAIFTHILTSSYLGDSLAVVWHSGEPLVLRPAYYRDAIECIVALRNKYCRPDFDIQFSMQTNGTLIDESWCAFFHEYRALLSVGISCDGPAFLHDAFRKNWAGNPTHSKTCRGIELLRTHAIPFDLIAVVTEETLAFPHEFLTFFRTYEHDVRRFHFNLLDELPLDSTDVNQRERYAQKYQRFLCALLDEVKQAGANADLLVIRNFTDFLARLFGDADTSSSYSARVMSRPFKTLNVATKGAVSTFYAGLLDNCEDIYRDGQGLVVGNLITQRLEEIAQSAKLKKIAQDFETSHRACEQSCEFFSLCSGGYNLIKYKRFGNFNATETPECFIHVKTFATVMLNDINRNASSLQSEPNTMMP